MPDERPEDSAAVLNAHRAGYDVAMNVRFVRASADEVVAEYDVGPEHRQPYGIVHGGVHCGVVETVCSTGAGLAALARGQSVVGVENHTSFIHAVRDGRITVRATPLTRGRRTQVWEAVAQDASGRLVATGRVRLLCLDPGSDLAGKPVAERRANPLQTDPER
jgi:1,4-dihydroxy-2-naphthoyl-CoA hydrolase